MGKWSNATLPEGLEERFNELRTCPISDIDSLWAACGSLSLGDFANMRWYWSSLNGWACIDNCEGPNPPANFKIFIGYEIYANDNTRLRMEKIAAILASEFNMPRKSHQSKPNDSKTIDAVFKVLSNIDSSHVAYHDPADERFIRDFLKIHTFCRDFGFTHALIYHSSSDLWMIDITDGNQVSRKRDTGCLSMVMKNTINYFLEEIGSHA